MGCRLKKCQVVKRLYLSLRGWVNKEQLGPSDVMRHLHERPPRDSHQKKVLRRSGFQTYYYFFFLLFFWWRIIFLLKSCAKTPSVSEIRADWVDEVRVGGPVLIHLSHLKQQSLKASLEFWGARMYNKSVLSSGMSNTENWQDDSFCCWKEMVVVLLTFIFPISSKFLFLYVW